MANEVKVIVIDYGRASLLLDIVQRASASGAALDALAREARAELLEMNADALTNATARAAKA